MPILMSYSSRSSGQQLLDETGFKYATDTANLGRLTQRVRTHHDGQSYATTEVFNCAADPELAGALLYTRTITTHDGLTVATSRSRSALTALLWSKTDALGVTIAYTYDALGRMISRTIDPGGQYQNVMTFDHVITGGTEEAYQVITTDCNGNQRCRGVDGAGRTVYTAPNSIDDGLKHPDPQRYQTVSCAYDNLGRLATRALSDWALDTGEKYAHAGTLGYDDWGQPCRMDYDDGTWTSRARDPIGLTTTIAIGGTNTQGSVTSGQVVRTYDVSGRLIKLARYASGADPSVATPYSTCTMKYDGLHRLRVQTDELGLTTTYDYDSWNRPVHTTLADGTVLTRHYRTDSTSADVVEITVANTAAKLAETSAGTRVFDGLGRVTSVSVGGRTWQYHYDAPNARSRLMDPRPSAVTAPDGAVRKYTYCPALDNNIKQIDVYPDASATKPVITQSFGYNNATGALTSAIEGTTTKQYTPYTSGRLKKQVQIFDGRMLVMTYDKYTLRGRERHYTHVDGAARVTKRNADGTISEVSDGDMKVALFYDPAGRLTSWTASDLSGATPNLTTTLTLDDYGREIGRSIAAEGDDPKKPSWEITQYWNPGDQLTQRKVKRAGASYRIENYKYDNRNRLSYWDSSGAPVNDRYGNVLRTQTFISDPFNNITQVDSTFLEGANTGIFNYTDPTDPCRLISFTNSDSSYPGYGNPVSPSYDPVGRITNDGMGQSLGYDALGRLTQASSALTSHTGSYMYDAHNRLSSQTVDGLGQATYFYYEAGALVNLVQGANTTRLLRSPVGCTSQYGSGGVWLSAMDQAGSVLAANHGSTTEGYSYSPYGEDKPKARASTLGYNGQYRDPVTPGYQLGNGYRAYLPALMRFAQPDGPAYSPFGVGGINPYAYCSSDPINHSDPSGHFSFAGLGDWLLRFTTKGGILSFLPDKDNPVAQAENLIGKFMHSTWSKYTALYWSLYALGWVQNKLATAVQQTTGLPHSWSELAAMGIESGATAGFGGEGGELGELGELGEVGEGGGEMGNVTDYDYVTTSGRFEGEPEESVPNFGPKKNRNADPDEPSTSSGGNSGANKYPWKLDRHGERKAGDLTDVARDNYNRWAEKIDAGMHPKSAAEELGLTYKPLSNGLQHEIYISQDDRVTFEMTQWGPPKKGGKEWLGECRILEIGGHTKKKK
ncbi:hypothetical protein BGV47_29295 [Burkholderia ubonensis]|uniref:RHS repeat-associated core domain-containing protein n=1 Tax=Burkholderia ubonensis TaxID=101571 RepID=UPI0008FD9B9A|nr:RHS repeat-associated core domain-containing protein [Burkholderia ubonensis]OJA26999.1 hypothetical protein BGV47_29295 [Burkholderia ubonensis]OJB26441.1 hypothetical protein BGV55_20505 [Burkholderia ubonensis]